MNTYTAEIINKDGKKLKITEEAISLNLFEDAMTERGYYIVKIKEGESDRLFIDLKDKKISRKFILDFTYNAHSLLDFGIDINEVFKILLTVYNKGIEKDFIEGIYSDLKKGESLSGSLKSYEKDFGDFYLTMIKAGEASGKLSDSFKLLYTYLNNIQKIKDKIVSASIYPGILLTMAFLALNLLFFFIIPNFGLIYKTMEFTPAAGIGIMIDFSSFLKEHVMLYVIFLAALIAGVTVLFKSKQGVTVKEKIFQKMPVFSKIYRLQMKIKISFSLEILLKGGASLEDGLAKLSEMEKSAGLKKDFLRALEGIKNGGSVKSAFSGLKVFDGRDLALIEISESISKTKEGFEKARTEAENTLDNYLDKIFKLIEPAMIILIGAFLFFIMYLVISPTLGMLEKF